MAWPYDNNPPDLVGALNLPPEPELSPQELGALAQRHASGGLSRNRFVRGIDKVVTHPLFKSLLQGVASGIAGDPTAGARMAAASQPSLNDELTQLRIRQAQAREAEIAQKRVDEIDRKAKIQELSITPPGPRADELYGELYPEERQKEIRAKPTNPVLVEKRLPKGEVQKVWVDPVTHKELGPFEETPVARWRPEGSEVVMGPDGTPIYAKGGAALKLTGPQVARAGERAARSSSVSDAMSLYPVIKANPALQARSGVAQPIARAAGVLSPSSAGSVRKWLTNDATPDQQALYNRVTEAAAGVATHIINKGATTEPDIARAKNMLSQSSDPETYQSALRDTIIMTIRSDNYDARDTGEQPDYDIRKDEDMLRLKAELQRQGFTDAEILDIGKAIVAPMPRWLQ